MAMPQRAGGWKIANDRRRPDHQFQSPRLSRTDSTLPCWAAMRAAVLTGPNAHYIDPSILDVELESIAVTFDINLLFAQKPRSTR
jgi:hypothetical protein